MIRGRQIGTLIVSALICPLSHAFELERAETRYHEERYELMLEATLAAPIDSVTHVLRDYERYPELDARVQKARVLERADPTHALLYTELEACFSFLCRTVERVEEVTESDHELLAVVVADRSDVTFGRTHTLLEQIDANTTRVTYRTVVQPKFWIPRFVGRRVMLRTLRDATVQLFERVERAAQANSHEATG